ncbi:DUF4404 family protein [Elongatibacter sediminis]|uniref:DUF4404 family protein n=1 Tax=Elongatibacter sediminis TaxID=3119006 RepID=A0AAW9RBK7_9GAMM
MADPELRQLLKDLHESLEDTRELDPETRALVHELDEDIHRLVAPEEETGADDIESARDKARELQARFQAEHPVAERFFREIVEVLSKVGI